MANCDFGLREMMLVTRIPFSASPTTQVHLGEARLSEAISSGRAKGLESEARSHELARVKQQLEVNVREIYHHHSSSY